MTPTSSKRAFEEWVAREWPENPSVVWDEEGVPVREGHNRMIDEWSAYAHAWQAARAPVAREGVDYHGARDAFKEHRAAHDSGHISTGKYVELIVDASGAAKDGR
jgi:hypothetical protein